ncbi:28S ribosomal protein S18b, mitochondrial, partial [Stegodyphus mimosarum]
MTSAILSRSDYTISAQNVRYLLPVAPKILMPKRSIKIWPQLFSESAEVVDEENDQEKKPAIDPSKDRTKIISPETSIRYMKSKAYKTTYGDEPVWVKYRRNFKGQFTPRKTRKTCIRGGVITTGSPCPICRDEYLVLHYTNVELLKQFINPYTGEIYDTRKIHICQKKLFELQVAIQKAKFYGLLTYDVPFREYDYKEYYPEWNS